MNSTADYKSIDELEAEAEKEAAIRDRALAYKDKTDQEAESEAASTAMSGLFSRVLGRKTPEADPFLELEMAEHSPKVSSEEAHLAKIEQQLAEERRALDDLKKQHVAASSPTTSESADVDDFASIIDKLEEATLAKTDDATDAFAEFTALNAGKTVQTKTASATTKVDDVEDDDVFAALVNQAAARGAKADAEPTKQSDPNPADALEALLAQNGYSVDSPESKSSKSTNRVVSRDAAKELDAFAASELGVDEGKATDASALRAFQSHAGKTRPGSAGPAAPESAFDSLLAITASQRNLPTSSSSNDAMLTEQSDTQPSSTKFAQAFADSHYTLNQSARSKASSAYDVFATLSAGQGAPLTDVSGFSWKDPGNTAPMPASNGWWNASEHTTVQESFASHTASSHKAEQTWLAQNTEFAESENNSLVVTAQAPANSLPAGPVSTGPVSAGLKPVTDSGQLLQTPAFQSASLSRSSAIRGGFESDPFFSTPALSEEHASETDGSLAAANDTPVIKPSGIFSVFTGKTWALLFGGAIVAFLLFAPGRNKPSES